ncbi:Exosome complex component rrp4, partial [Coemansia sp. BCRC 34490]
MDVDTEPPATRDIASRIVTPGTLITSDPAYMRGHGTFVENTAIYSSVAGAVERINKLVSVRPLKQRYGGEIGDIIVGRITEVAAKRWRVDVNSRQDGVLLLSSINLPGGIQRRKSESDELQMRSFFAEGDLVFAEVQSYFADGAL